MRAPPSTMTDRPDWPDAWTLFLDIDGTLLDLAPRPELVVVPPDLPARLGRLADTLGGALALVSGRPLATIDRLFPVGLDAVGTHGAEWRLGGQVGEVAPAGRVPLAAIARALEEPLRQLPGVWLEPKPKGLALHFRAAAALESQALRLARQAVRTLGSDYRLQAGKQVVEILPAQASKGAGIRRFLASPPYVGRTPIFVGDDLTDEDGFAAVNALGGISVRVGAGDGTQARHELAVPADLRHWLEALAASLKA
jgi:trehalose 6-phosphate phosphatase